MHAKLLTEMRKRKITQTSMAKMLGITFNSVNNKLTGKNEFTCSEMFKICEVINDVPMQELFKKE